MARPDDPRSPLEVMYRYPGDTFIQVVRADNGTTASIAFNDLSGLYDDEARNDCVGEKEIPDSVIESGSSGELQGAAIEILSPAAIAEYAEAFREIADFLEGKIND